MSICWYCHWGWAKPVMDIYDEALAKLDGNYSPLNFGPAHIVWEDENFETHHVQFCIDHFDEYGYNLTDHERSVVMESLEKMAKLPEEQRCIEPPDYDGVHPEDYPPTVEVVRR